MMTSSPIASSMPVTTFSNVMKFNTTLPPPAFKTEWTASFVLTVLFIIFGFYVTTSLIIYECMMVMKNRKRDEAVKVRDKSRVNWMRWLCLGGSVCALVRFALELLEVQSGNTQDYICNVARQTKAVFLSGAFSCIYMVLWLRQRKFYQSPALLHLSGRWVRFFSASVIILMIFANVVTTALYLFTREYKSSYRGCILKCSTIWSKLPGILLFIFTCSFQVILIGLLIYPLYKHRSVSRNIGQQAEMRVVKRVAIEAFVTVITTVICNIVAVAALTGGYGLLRQLIYDFDVSICMLAVIHSFCDWRARLFPCLMKTEVNSQSTERSVQTRNTLTSMSSLTIDETI